MERWNEDFLKFVDKDEEDARKELIIQNTVSLALKLKLNRKQTALLFEYFHYGPYEEAYEMFDEVLARIKVAKKNRRRK